MIPILESAFLKVVHSTGTLTEFEIKLKKLHCKYRGAKAGHYPAQ